MYLESTALVVLMQRFSESQLGFFLFTSIATIITMAAIATPTPPIMMVKGVVVAVVALGLFETPP